MDNSKRAEKMAATFDLLTKEESKMLIEFITSQLDEVYREGLEDSRISHANEVREAREEQYHKEQYLQGLICCTRCFKDGQKEAEFQKDQEITFIKHEAGQMGVRLGFASARDKAAGMIPDDSIFCIALIKRIRALSPEGIERNGKLEK